MIALKIIGTALAVIALLIFIILISRAKLFVQYTEENKLELYLGFWFLKFKLKAKEKIETKKKKSGRFVQSLKKRLGLDIFDSEELKNALKEGGLSAKIGEIVAVIMLFSERIKWLISKLRADKFGLTVVCGGDSAHAAIEYGLVCSAVYPLSAFLTNNFNFKKNAEDIKIGCDFDGESYFQFNFGVSVRIFHLLKVAIDCLKDISTIAEKAEVLQNERR